MDIKDIEVSELIPYEKNPRKNDNAVDAVANSIKQFGFKVPIVIDADNVIVAGHTRLKAAKVLGLQSVPCVVADDLTPKQLKAFRLADNKTAELASWDFEPLDEELAELSVDIDELGFDMNDFGFEHHTSIDIDNFFEPNESATTKKKKSVKCPHCGQEFEL